MLVQDTPLPAARNSINLLISALLDFTLSDMHMLDLQVLALKQAFQALRSQALRRWK